MAKLTELIDGVVTPIEPGFEAHKLLDVADAQLRQDHDTFKQLGFKNNTIIDLYDSRERDMFVDQTATIYGRASFNTKDLKKIAVAYNLRLLKTTRFKGKVPHNITSDITKFCKKHEIALDGHLSENFYILGPEENFLLEEVQKPRPIDPVLLYKIDNNEYIPVVQWGKELNFFRYLNSLSKRSTGARALSIFIKITLITFFGISLFTGLLHWLPIVASILLGAIGTTVIIENTDRWQGTASLWDRNITRKGYRND